MALNVKILLDPKFYYQKLQELASKSKNTFSGIGSDIRKIFHGIRDSINGTSIKGFAENIVLAGGVMGVFQKAVDLTFRFIDTAMQNSKQRFLDYFNSLKEAADTYAAYEKRQQQVNSDNSSALEKISGLQLSGPALNHTQREEQRQALETLRKTYRGLKIDIDEATGKIKNFEEIQSNILSSDQKKELILVQQQIKYLEKQNKIGQHNITYKGGFFSEYIQQLKETYNWGTAQEIGGALKANVDKLMELRYREFDLKYRDRAADASALYAAKRKDMQAQKADFLAKEQVNDQDVQKASSGVSEREQADALKLINELKKQGIELTEAEAAAVLRKRQALESAKYYKEQISILQDQIAAQTRLASGMDEQAQRQRLINELKKRGLEHDEKSIQKILELNAALGSAKLKNSQVKEVESLYDRALRAVGRTKEADERKALARAEETKGSPLSEEEKAATLKLLELTSSLDKMSDQKVTGDFAIKTNSLTARGGFQTGARVPDSSQYERQIAQNTQKHSEIVTRIETLLREVMQ